MYQNEEENRFPKRKSPRIKDYDYSAQNYYFVTICTHQKQCIFGDPMALNTFGVIAEKLLLEIPVHFSGVIIDKYVIMPNHIHVIFNIAEKGISLIDLIGSYKSAVTKEIHKVQPKLLIWQKSFHDHIIRNQNSYEKIWNYIDGNPLKWNEDCFYIGK